MGRAPAQINLRRPHDVIQLIMGWEDCHPYKCEGRHYSEPDPFDAIGADGAAHAVDLKLHTL